MWDFFRQPSLYGREILTHGGRRGPARAYYLPSLSAMQLFLPAEAPDGASAHRPRHQIYSHEADWGPCWTSSFRPLAELFETVGNLCLSVCCTKTHHLSGSKLQVLRLGIFEPDHCLFQVFGMSELPGWSCASTKWPDCRACNVGQQPGFVQQLQKYCLGAAGSKSLKPWGSSSSKSDCMSEHLGTA